MPRKIRIEYPGAIYHVLNRGDRREDIFRDELDRRCFLKTLTETCAKTGFQVHAFCLMSNHFHLVLETPNAGLIDGMRWFLSTYTSRFNHRHRLVGHLFSGRYKSPVVDGSGTGYLRTVCDYVHLNPVRAKLLAPEQGLREYGWSSYPSYLAPPEQRPAWLRVDRLLGEHGLGADTEASRQIFAERMETRRRGELEAGGKYQRGWCIGDKPFKEKLLWRIAGQLGEHHPGSLRMEAAAARAEAMVLSELTRLGWSESDLAQLPKGETRKLALAARLRAETTVSIRWIAGRLSMGSWKTLTSRLYQWRKAQEGGNTRD